MAVKMERKASALALVSDETTDEELATCEDLSDLDSISSSIFDEEVETTAGESHLYRYSLRSPLPPVEEKGEFDCKGGAPVEDVDCSHIIYTDHSKLTGTYTTHEETLAKEPDRTGSRSSLQKDIGLESSTEHVDLSAFENDSKPSRTSPIHPKFQEEKTIESPGSEEHPILQDSPNPSLRQRLPNPETTTIVRTKSLDFVIKEL